nr:hypothetical protein [Microbacterium hydrocarbonoxydans]
MSGIEGVIARVGEIESRIVALDPAARSSVEAVSAPAGADAETPTAAASTFAGLLEAVTGATAGATGAEARVAADSDASAGSETTASTSTASTTTAASTLTSADAAELVSALQTLFAASSSTTGSASSLQQYAGLIG